MGSRGVRAVGRALFALALLCGVAGTHPLETETTGTSSGSAADVFALLLGAPHKVHGSGFPSAVQLANFEARVRAWSERQGDADRPAIVAHPQFGLGNRISSVVSSLALALITDRRFFIEWGEHFSPLFSTPFDSVPPRALIPSTSDILDLSASSPSLGSFANATACGSVDALLPTNVTHLLSDQYFLPLLLANSEARARLAALFTPLDSPSDEEGVESASGEGGEESAGLGAAQGEEVGEAGLFATLGRWALQPSEEVRRAVLAFELGMGGRCVVGVHVRVPMFDWEHRQVPDVDPEEALQCARRAFLSQLRHQAANSTSARGEHDDASSTGGGSSGGVVFVASTSEAVRMRAREMFAKRGAWTSGATGRLEPGGAGEKQALMDLILLSRCQEIVSSVHSTFSYAAHALAGVTPWVVSSRSPPPHGGGGGRASVSKCIRATGPEPCFHAGQSLRPQVSCASPRGEQTENSRRDESCWY
ncbi:hypothetical protein T484DRAFT_1901175 [Baffinella frigidus]|nr:hypothetical protein T484DRAFT_1901175 [Cryptophyta sp. CCMP2293]